jgi:hypothetical protein
MVKLILPPGQCGLPPFLTILAATSMIIYDNCFNYLEVGFPGVPNSAGLHG